MTTPVPDEIRKAAHDATTLPLDRALQTSPYGLVDLAVDAVYPLIAAAERERIRQMAADLNAVVPQAICNGVTLSTVPFADLIAGEDSEARQWETGEDGSDA